jgi:N-acetylglucosaminyldiphosphoundecaprenol N-acetyl-beta-D-mannosaminyltransferase
LPIDTYTEPEAVARVTTQARAGRGGTVITPNLDILRRYVVEPDVRRHFEQADVVVADGMPLVWAASLAGNALPGRVAGSDLIWSVSRACVPAELSIFLLGGSPESVERAADRLQDACPGLRLAGRHSPPFGFEDDRTEMAKIIEVLGTTRPDIVFVGLGFPKQENLIEELRPLFPTVWFLGVGISIDLVAGEVDRAPEWVQRSGLEWVHRLLQEPRRLFRRYLVHGLPFAVRLLAWSVARRIAGVR